MVGYPFDLLPVEAQTQIKVAMLLCLLIGFVVGGFVFGLGAILLPNWLA